MEKSNENINVNDSLTANKFRLVFPELKAMELLCRSAPIPSVTANAQEIVTPHNNIFVQGQKVTYEPLNVTFRVDKNLVSYRKIFQWFTDIHSPVSPDGFNRYQDETKTLNKNRNNFSVSASLMSLTNSMNTNLEVNFIGIYPTSISSIDFSLDSTDGITATATFQYDYFTFRERS